MADLGKYWSWPGGAHFGGAGKCCTPTLASGMRYYSTWVNIGHAGNVDVCWRTWVNIGHAGVVENGVYILASTGIGNRLDCKHYWWGGGGPEMRHRLGKYSGVEGPRRCAVGSGLVSTGSVHTGKYWDWK